jgi:hypothetical protein
MTCRNVGDLVSLGLPLVDRAAEQLEGFQEERGDEVRLQPPGVGPLHVLPNGTDAGGVHRVVARARPSISSRRCSGQSALSTTWSAWPDLRPVAVADGLHEQFPQRAVLEGQPPRTSKTWPPSALRSSSSFSSSRVHLALAGLLGDEVPQVADLGLADAVDAPEALLQRLGFQGRS